MKFCEACDNMYYLKLQDDTNDNLVYYCRNCGKEDMIDGNATTVMKTTVNGNDDTLINNVNKYTKYDNTIPRVKEVHCANASCQSHDKPEAKDILLIRHDELNMKYLYLCGVCDYVWKSSIK